MPYADPIKQKKYQKKYNHNWYLKAKKRFKKKCEVCKKTFFTRYFNQRFCSLKCAGLNKKGSGYKNICIICSKEFDAGKSKKRKYCSRKCMWKDPRQISGSKKRLKQAVKSKLWHKNLLKGIKNADRTNHIERLKSLTGEKNPAWKGGISPKHKLVRAKPEYKNWREKVFKRDNWTCQLCGDRSKKGNSIIIQADHFPILFSKLLKDKNWKVMWDIDNGRTLCLKCHKKETKKLYEKRAI